MLKNMDLDYYHFQACSTLMLDSHSLYISMIETSSENNDAWIKSELMFQEFFISFR